MSWKIVENSNDIKPLEVDETSSNHVVYVRRNFELVDANDERPTHYRYEENEVPKENWETYKAVLNHDTQLTDAELAIVELYELIIG